MSIIIDPNDISLNEEQATSLKHMVDEAVNAKYQIDGHGDFIKTIRERAKGELQIPNPMFNKLVKLAYKKNADKLNHEMTALLDLAEQIGEYSHEE